jgi:hypothetical protein
MKIKKWHLVLLFVMFTLFVGAQNKVGDHPEVIQKGSLLELESLDKGLRLPRISLADASNWQLLGSPVSGMMIFNEDGLEPKGIYYWSTQVSKWVRVVNNDELPDLIKKYNELNTEISLTSAGNVLRTTLNGLISNPALIVNTNTLTDPGADVILSTVNGIQGPLAPKIGIVTKTLGFDNNGFLVKQIPAHSLDLDASGKLVRNENGVPGDFTVPKGDVITTIGLDVLGKFVMQDAKLIKPSNLIEIKDGKIITTVNGETASALLVNDNNLACANNKFTSTVNGVSSSVDFVPGTIKNSVGFNSLGALTVQDATKTPVSNNISTALNTIKSTVNGIASAANIVTSNDLSSADFTLTSAVNGKPADLKIDDSPIDYVLGFNDEGKMVRQLSTGMSVDNQFTNPPWMLASTVNGEGSSITPALGVVGYTLGFDGAGILVRQPATAMPVTNKLTSAINELTSTVNGVEKSAKIVNSNSLTAAGSAFISTVNGVSDTFKPLSGDVKNIIGFSEGGTLVSTPYTVMPVVNTLISTGNNLTSLVNGYGNSQPIINANEILINAGLITTSVNGIVSPFGVNVLTQAGAGLNSSGGTVSLGGSLNKKTAIVADNINTLAIQGLQSGTVTDNVVLADPSTGVLRQVSQSNSLTATANTIIPKVNGKVGDALPVINGLSADVNGLQLGGALTANTTITTTSGSTLAIAGLQSGTTGDNIVLADAAGVLKKTQATATNLGSSIVARDASGDFAAGTITSKSLNNSGSTILGFTTANNSAAIYNILQPTVDTFSGVVITQTGTTGAIAISNPTASTSGRLFAIGNATSSTFPLKVGAYSIAKGQSGLFVWNGTDWSLPSGSIAANNGLTIAGGEVTLGGPLTTNTEIDATSKTFSIKGLGAGTTGDNVVLADVTTGILKKVLQSNVLAASSGKLKSTVNGLSSADVDVLTSADNGLTNTAGKITLGGALSANTEIDATGKVLSIKGADGLKLSDLSAGTTADNVVLADVTTGVLKKVLQSNVLAAASGKLKSTVNGLASADVDVLTSAENGLTNTAGKITLGGALTAATTVTTDATKSLTFSGADGFILPSLATGAATENVVTVNASGVLHQRALDLGVTPITKVIGTYAITTADYTVVLKGATSDASFTLPAAPELGRTFRIINLSTYKITLDKPVRTAVDVTLTEVGPGTASVAGNTMGNKLTIQWDGTEWIQVGN